MTVIKDAADVVRGLVSLDRRYANVANWQSFPEAGRLGRAAATCATGPATADLTTPSTDAVGDPRPRSSTGPGLPGITGVLQAQHNLLIHLGHFPTPRTCAWSSTPNANISRETARQLAPIDPVLAERWQQRGVTYGRLVREARDLGGVFGVGGAAAGQGALAVTRMTKLDDAGLSDAHQVRRLQRVSAGIDERVCNVIGYGAAHRPYFHRISLPRPDNDTGELVHGARQKFIPITSAVQSELLAIVCSDLRPTPIQRKPPKGAARSRLDFEAALRHRPPPRGASPDIPPI